MGKAELLFGEETFLIDEHLQKATAGFSSQDILRFNENATVDQLLQAVSMTSLFSPSNAIVIKNPKWLTNSADDKELKQLTQLFALIPQQPHHVVIVVFGSVDQRKKAAQLLKKHCDVTQYSPFKDWEQDKILTWIQNRVKIYKKMMTQDAVLALENIGGLDLRQMASELEKLDIYTGARTTITKEDVEAMCAPANTSIFDFTEALKSKQLSSALSSLTRLMAHGEDPIKLLGLITATYRLYLQLLSLSAERLSPTEIATKIGKNPYFIQKLLPEVKKRYSLPQVKKAFDTLATCDFDIKSGKMKPELALEMAVVLILA